MMRKSAPAYANKPLRKKKSIRPTLELLEDRVTPSAGLREQYMLELVNRMRTNPAAELSLLLNSGDPNVASALAYFHVDIATLQSQWSTLTPVPPLAWNDNLAAAAVAHNQAMIAAGTQSHQLPGEADLGTRITNAGYGGWSYLAENIFAFADSVFYGHAALAIDWGSTPTGIQNPPGHRQNLMSSSVRDIGIGITDAGAPLGPLVLTQDFGNRLAYGNPYLLGVVYNDANANGFYDQGEGLAANLSITGPGGTTNITASAFGGYQLQVPSGSYTITASGGGLNAPITQTIFVGANNLRLNFINGSGSQNASIPFADNFNRSNNAILGSYWRETGGNFSVVNNLAISDAGVASDASLNGISRADTVLQADVNAAGGSAGLSSRYGGTGDRDMYLGAVTNLSGTYVAGIYRNVGGAWTQLAATALSAGAGTLRFETVGTSLRLYFNNVLVGAATDAALTTGGVGLRTWSQASFDNFSATAPAAPPAPTNATLPFNDALTSGSGLSTYWATRAGSFAIASGRLQGGSAVNDAVLNGVNQSNVAVQANVNVVGGGLLSAGLVARYAGAGDSNMYLGALTGSSGAYTAAIFRNVGGEWTQLSAAAVGVGSGTLRFEVAGTSLKLFLNGQLVAFAYDSILTGGSVGVRSYGAAAYTNFAADVLAVTSPGMPYTDAFATTGTGGQLNSNWLSRAGTFTLAAPGQMRSSAGISSVATVNGVNQANVVVQADVNVGAAGLQSAGLVARYAGAGDSNMYLGTLTGSSGSYVAAILLNLNGAWTQLSAAAVGSGVGTLRFEVVGTSLKLFLNGQLVTYANDSTLAAGGVGLRAYSSVAYANFNTSVVTPLTAALPFTDNFSSLTTGSQLGRTWLTRAGAFTGNPAGQMISSNDPGSIAVLNGLNQANVRVQADISVSGPGLTSAGLITRYTVAGDMYLGAVTGVNGVYTANIYRYYQGTWALLASASIGSGTGTLRFESFGAAQRLYWNNVLVAAATDSILASGTVGLRSYLSVVYDNFSATAL